jgi:hypothetical protein
VPSINDWGICPRRIYDIDIEDSKSCEPCKIMNSKRSTPVLCNYPLGCILSADLDVMLVISVEGYKYRLDIVSEGIGS